MRRFDRRHVVASVSASVVTAVLLSFAPGAGAEGRPSSAPGTRSQASSGTLTTLAGGVGAGPQLAVAQSPYFFAFGPGRLYVSDLVGNAVRSIDTSTGEEVPLAGTGFPGYTGDGGPAGGAEVNQPAGIAVDPSGDVFVVDQNNERVREIPSSTGIQFGFSMTAGDIYTIAGTGSMGFAGDGGPATQARFALPEGIALDSTGDVLVADTYNGRIREIAATNHTQFGIPMTAGDIYTVAGNGLGGDTAVQGDGGPATGAEVGTPQGVSLDAAGDIFVTQDLVTTGLQAIPAPVREIAATTHVQFGISMTDGDVYSVAGGTSSTVCAGATNAVGDGCIATQAVLLDPVDAVTDQAGNLYITDYYHDRVREVRFDSGVVTTFAGTGSGGYGGEGGPATSAELSFPTGLAFNASGDLYISDSTTIRKVAAATDTITQVVGNQAFSFSGDGGPAAQAQFGAPVGVASDGNGVVYVADAINNVIRKVSADGIVTTIAGNGFGVGGVYQKGGYAGDGGPAAQAELDLPTGVVADSTGDVFVADSKNNRVREISASTGDITTFAGDGSAASTGDGGSPASAGIFDPTGVAIDAHGDVFVVESSGSRLREIAASTGNQFGTAMTQGDIYTVAGTGAPGDSGDGGPAAQAQLGHPFAVAVDAEGDVFVADQTDNAVRIIAATAGNRYGLTLAPGDIYTVAGTGTSGYSGDGGTASTAELARPSGVAVDGSGNLWISDTANHRVREVTSSAGNIATVAGDGTPGFVGDGGAALDAELGLPVGLGFDGNGDVLVAEYAVRSGFGYADATGRVESVSAGATPPVVPPGPPNATMSAGYWMVDSAGNVYAFGSATNYGSASLPSVVSIAAMPSGAGYWVANSFGYVDAFGAAKAYKLSAQPRSSVSTVTATSDGGGFWLVTSGGQVITAGDAVDHGSPSGSGVDLARPIVDMVATPDGNGYWLLAADGGVFAYGDASFHGSTGNIKLNQPAVAMVATADGAGYWFVASDGGVFAFGDAGFSGSSGQIDPSVPPGPRNSFIPVKPINGIVATADGGGYWMVASDGGVFAFGDAGFVGSLGSRPPVHPVVGMAAS